MATETKCIMKFVGDSIAMARQISILLKDDIKFKVFTYFRLLLESIVSSNRVTKKALRQSVAFLKPNLKDEKVEYFA